MNGLKPLASPTGLDSIESTPPLAACALACVEATAGAELNPAMAAALPTARAPAATWNLLLMSIRFMRANPLL